MGTMREWKFTVPGDPVAWARARTNGPQQYTPAKQRKAKSDIGYLCLEAMTDKAPLEGPVELTVVAAYERPKRGRQDTFWKQSRPDLDNVAKLVMDALNGIAWVDDGQVSALHALKQWGEPEVRIFVRELA
jgi:Holliday junction resolvase RusA-like endonuclease